MFQNKQSAQIFANKLFSNVNENEVNFTFNPKACMQIKEGDIIFQTGDESNFVYLVIEGEVKQKISGIFSSPIIVKKTAGDFFGEKEIIDKTPRISSAVANTDCQLYPIPKEELNKLISSNKTIQRNLFTIGSGEDIPESGEINLLDTSLSVPPPGEPIIEIDSDSKSLEENLFESVDNENTAVDFTDKGTLSPPVEEEIIKENFSLTNESVPPKAEPVIEDNEEYLQWDFSASSEKEKQDEEPLDVPLDEDEEQPAAPLNEDEELPAALLDGVPLIAEEKHEESIKSDFDPLSVFPETEPEPVPDTEKISEPQKFSLTASFEEVSSIKPFDDNPMDEFKENEVHENIEKPESISPEPELVEKPRSKNGDGLPKEKFHLIIQAAQKVNSNFKLDKVLNSIVEAAQELTNADRCTLYIVDKEKNELWSKILIGDDVKEIRLKIGDGLAGAAAQNNEIINLEDVHTDSRFNSTYDKVSGYITKNNLCFPINNKDGDVIAVIQLINSANGKFDEIDEECLSVISTNVALALENANLVEKLVQADRLTSLGKMANFLIQDIKKPILTIKHYAEHIKKKEISNDIKQVLNLLTDQANLIADLVQSTLSFSQGKSVLRTQTYSVADVVNEVLAQLAEYVEGRKTKLFKKYETDALVSVDKREFYQACFQIVKNACDAMPDGGNVFIVTKADDQNVSIEIRDNGIGIPDSIKDRIFEPFMSHGKKNGNGLGLSIAEKIIKDHAGTITVESELGEGASFFINLPAVK